MLPRWTSLKVRAVFQYLLIHQDRPTRRDVLMALQWPDHSRNSARNNLNVALYSLRNTLEGLGHGAQPVLYRDGCYLLNPELSWWIDRNEFLSASASTPSRSASASISRGGSGAASAATGDLCVTVPPCSIPVERCGTLYQVGAKFEMRCCGGCNDARSYAALAGHEPQGEYMFV